MNEEEVNNYLSGDTDWKYDDIATLLLEGEGEAVPAQDSQAPVVVVPKPNLIFGKIFDGFSKFVFSYCLELSVIISPPSPPPEVVKLPDFPVKACITGKVFSGKTTLAQKICEKYNTNLLSPEQVIQESTQSLQEPGKLIEQFFNRLAHIWLTPSAKQYAEAAVKALKEGKEVEDKVLVGLLIERIRNLEKSEKSGGWLIDGFPRTANQAQLFEKELTGFEPPKVRKRKAVVKRGLISSLYVNKKVLN